MLAWVPQLHPAPAPNRSSTMPVLVWANRLASTFWMHAEHQALAKKPLHDFEIAGKDIPSLSCRSYVPWAALFVSAPTTSPFFQRTSNGTCRRHLTQRGGS